MESEREIIKNDAEEKLTIAEKAATAAEAMAIVVVERPQKFRRICVFCGSSPGKKTSYQDAAVELGNQLVERNIDLVYGGGSIGLMGLVARAVHDGGRHVLGVIPKSLMLKEITGLPIGEVIAVSGMHERKATMSEQADAFIALPGGYGTMEELMEVITWSQLGIHHKPLVACLEHPQANYGFYDTLLSFMDLAVSEGFISETARSILVSAPNAKELLRKLEEYMPERDEIVEKLRWDDCQPTVKHLPEPPSGVSERDEIVKMVRWETTSPQLTIYRSLEPALLLE